MPVADYKIYCKMLEKAREGHFAYPAINVSSMETANAVLKGLAESKSDGIIQVSTGGGAFASGSSVKDMALGAISIAEHVHRAADYDAQAKKLAVLFRENFVQFKDQSSKSVQKAGPRMG